MKLRTKRQLSLLGTYPSRQRRSRVYCCAVRRDERRGIILRAQNGRRQNMYYRIAIRWEGDQLNQPPSWQWKSTVLSSLQALFQILRLYGPLPQEHLRVFSSSSRGSLEEKTRRCSCGRGP